MDVNLKQINLDKSNWKLVKFGEIAKEPKENAKDLHADGIEHVVGLEHIDPEDIHLRRSANPETSTTFTKKFAKGDVLFGRRRAYLKKAAQAPFSGICSGDITVFRAKDSILPELLPFVVCNDKFFDYAVKHSAGGLSPRVKFKDLANYQFLLPPKDQQKQLAELLWAMDDVIEKENELLTNLERSLNTKIENSIHGNQIQNKTINQVLEELEQKRPVKKLSLLGEFFKGKGISKSEVEITGIPCIRYGELYTHHYRIIREFNSFVTPKVASGSFKLEKNDVVFAGSGETITEIGQSAAFIDDVEAYAGGDTLVFRPKNMDGTYAGYLMNCQLVRQQLNKYGTGATVMHIYRSDLEKIRVPQVDFETQVKIGTELEQFANDIKYTKLKIASSNALQKSLVNQIF
jgi:type I restriction enzyme, S subunit